MLQESRARARANAGKLNTQGHAGRGGHRARDDGGDVRSTRAVGAQMQVGRDARKIAYPGTHAESTCCRLRTDTVRRGTRGARGAAGIERAAAAAAALSGVWRVGAPPQVGNKALESVYPGNHAEATFYLASSGGRSTEAGCDSCRRVTRCKGGSVNSKAT